MTNDVETQLHELADQYLELHQRKESLFWDTKMGLSQEHDALQRAELELRAFVGDPQRLRTLGELRARPDLSPREGAVLDGWIEMLRRHVLESEEARAIERDLVAAEVELERRRVEMALGYHDPASGERVLASSVVLSTMVRTETEEARRRAAWDGLRSVERFVLDEGFCEVARLRNRLARALGHEDYYERKVRQAEGFDKATLFGILDDLVARTEDTAREELARLADGAVDGTRPWNHGFVTSGSLAAELEPYFGFADALDRWGRSFAALGIRYRQARVVVDLIDRPGKYENGFMHGPVPAFRRRGAWLPAQINFTANAVPDQLGAGLSATVTLFHEGGHAAHFANILTDAPCFSQEFAPTSVAFSETQSMLLDSLVSDAEWQVRYALDAQGQPIPFDLIRRNLELLQPSRASGLRRMLTVSYFEKALYELPDAEMTPDRLLALAREVERDLLFFDEGAPRPLLSVPHLLSGDASCYYHGYVLATVALEQTKEHFRRQYGYVVDNPRVGADLAREYWAPGNAVGFLDYVRRLTGRALSNDDLVRKVTRRADEAVADARAAIEVMADVPLFEDTVDLDVDMAVVHGAETVVPPGIPFRRAAEAFRSWVRKRWPRETGRGSQPANPG